MVYFQREFLEFRRAERPKTEPLRPKTRNLSTHPSRTPRGSRGFDPPEDSESLLDAAADRAAPTVAEASIRLRILKELVRVTNGCIVGAVAEASIRLRILKVGVARAVRCLARW